MEKFIYYLGYLAFITRLLFWLPLQLLFCNKKTILLLFEISNYSSQTDYESIRKKNVFLVYTLKS